MISFALESPPSGPKREYKAICFSHKYKNLINFLTNFLSGKFLAYFANITLSLYLLLLKKLFLENQFTLHRTFQFFFFFCWPVILKRLRAKVRVLFFFQLVSVKG